MSNWTPSIVPRDDDRNVYLVVDDLGRYGLVWREADFETTDLETVIQDLMTGQYNSLVRVVSFNTAEGWSSDVSADVAQEVPPPPLRFAVARGASEHPGVCFAPRRQRPPVQASAQY